MSKREHERRDGAIRYRLSRMGLVVRRSRKDGLYRVESRGMKLQDLEALYGRVAS